MRELPAKPSGSHQTRTAAATGSPRPNRGHWVEDRLSWDHPEFCVFPLDRKLEFNYLIYKTVIT